MSENKSLQNTLLRSSLSKYEQGWFDCIHNFLFHLKKFKGDKIDKGTIHIIINFINDIYKMDLLTYSNKSIYEDEMEYVYRVPNSGNLEDTHFIKFKNNKFIIEEINND
jgi:hypothetical protein